MKTPELAIRLLKLGVVPFIDKLGAIEPEEEKKIDRLSKKPVFKKEREVHKQMTEFKFAKKI